jgi:MFS family permease
VIIVIFGGIYLTFSSLDSVLALYGNARLGMDEIMIGLVFMGAGIVMIITQGVFIGYLTKKLGNNMLIIVGSGLLAFSFYGISLATSFIGLMILVLPIAVGMSFVEPAGLTLLTKATPKANQGEILGLNDSFGAFVRILGSLGATSLYSINIVYPWIFNTIVMMLVIFIAILLYVKVNRSQLVTTVEKERIILLN